MIYVINAICFVAEGLILGSLGAYVNSWQYWATIVVMFIYGLANKLAD